VEKQRVCGETTEIMYLGICRENVRE